MKRKVLIALCVCMIGVAGMTSGCGDKKEETPVVEEKEPELKTIGKEDKEAFKVEIKNATGKTIKGIAIKQTDEESYPENMLEDGDVFTDQESRNLYYKAPEDTTKETEENTEDMAAESEKAQEKELEQGYDIQLTFEDDSTAELHAFPFEDIEKGEICYEDDVAYLTYTSVASKEELNTKEAELAVKVAEQKAAEEAAAQAAAEQKAAEQKAAEEAAAAAAAQKSRSSSSNSYSSNNSSNESGSSSESSSSASEPSSDAGAGSSDSSGDDACLDDGLLY
ncbi:hypothetical protein DWZ26_00260 [Ruminococcus sp. AF31-14BH]|nr:hypothetical protein DWZ26_00260 [Ruminococcus sp. AF31-14BH]